MDNSSDEYPRLLGTARELYGRVVWTHKTHEKQREIWSLWAVGTHWTNVLLVGTTTVLAVLSAYYGSREFGIASGSVGGLATAFLVFQLSFRPSHEEAAHRQAAKKLLSIRDRYLVLILDIMTRAEPLGTLRTRLANLSSETSAVYEYAPDTSSAAYDRADEALKRNDEMTFSAEELDRLLPASLRIHGAGGENGADQRPT